MRLKQQSIFLVLLLLLAQIAFSAPEQPQPLSKPVAPPQTVIDKKPVHPGVASPASPRATSSPVAADLLAIFRGDAARKRVALTFDDGPHQAFTLKLLAALKAYHVKATFFVVGMKVDEAPDLVRAEVADGHCIGNHTYHHLNLNKLTDDQIRDEIATGNQAIKRITGKTPHYFRPPGGDFGPQVVRTALNLGCLTVMGADNPKDYLQPPAEMIESRILREVGNGSIIVLHDGIQQTIDMLPSLITTLRAEGYQFVTLDELLEKHASETHEPNSPHAKPIGGPARPVPPLDIHLVPPHSRHIP